MATGSLSGTAVPPPLPQTAESNERERTVQRELARAGSQMRLVDLGSGLLFWLAGVILLFIAAALFDHVVGLGTLGRFLMLAVLVAGSLWYLLLHVAPLLVRAINPAYAAKTIEDATPSFKNSLINFLLLREDRSGIREIVYQAVEKQAAADIVRVPVESTIDRTPLIHAGYLLCGVMAVLAAYKILSPKDPFQTVARVIAPWADIVRPSRVEVTDLEPGNSDVYYGRTVQVSATIRGLRSSERVAVKFSSADGQIVDQAVEMQRTAGDRFEGVLPPPQAGASALAVGLQQNVTYRVVAGDAETSHYRLNVISAPTIVVEKLELVFPPYTKKPTEIVEQQGDIKALEGTKVKLHALANQPIRAAWLEMDPMDRDGAAELVTLTAAGERAQGALTLLLKPDRLTPWRSTYQVRFHNQRAEKSQQPIVHKIDVLRDLPPEVQIVQPERQRMEVAEDGELTVEVRGVDPDFGLSALRIEASSPGKQPIKLDLLPDAASHPPKAAAAVALRPREHALKAGDVLTYQAIAEDNRAHPQSGQPESNVARTREYQIVVLPPEKKNSNSGEGKQNPGAGAQGQNKQPNQNSGNQPPQQPPSNKQSSDQQNQKSGDQQERQQEPNQGQNPDQKSGDKQEPSKSGQEQSQQPQDAQSKESQPNESQSKETGDQKSGDNSKGDRGKQAGEQQQTGQQGDKQSGSPQPGGNQSGEQQNDQPQSGGQQNEGKQGKGQQNSTQQNSGERNPSDQQGEPSQSGQGSSGSQPGDQKTGAHSGGNERSSAQSGQSGESGQPGQSGPEKSATGGKRDNSDSQGKAEHDGQAIERLLEELKRRGQADDLQGDQQGQQGSSGQHAGKGQKPSDQKSFEPQENSPSGSEPGAGTQSKGAQATGESGQPNAGTPNAGRPEPTDQQAGNQKSGQSEKGQQDQGKKDGASDRLPGDKQGESPAEQPGSGSKGGAPQGPNKTDKGEKSPLSKGEKHAGGAGKQGDEGAGDKTDDKTGSGPGQKKNADRPKEQKSDNQSSGPGEPSPPSDSKRQSDSKGGQSGENSGGGKQGAGQSAGQEGNDSAGNKSAADEGTGKASETGAGETGSKAGEGPKADGKTGQSASERGQGSGAKAGGQQPGAGPQPEPGKGDGQSDQGKATSQKSGNAAGSAPVGGSDGEGERIPPPPASGEEQAADEANLDYARKATEMVLRRLKEEEHNPDPELLKKLGWSADDLTEFLRRWDALQKSASQSPDGKRELDEAFRSLGIRDPENRRRAGGKVSDTQRDLRDGGNRSAAPARYRDLFDAFRKGATRTQE